MSDEEKKATERMEDVFYQDLGKGINKFQKITLYEDSITDIRTILNLIEKQSKEIEELKEKYSKKLIEFQKEREWYEKNYISKDKIKAKIEEISKEWAEGELEGEWYEFMKYHLESLLEKEE